MKEYVNPKSICVIGDGKINGILGAHLTFPKAKIFSVNLAEVLINDNLILEKTNIDLKKSVTLVDDLNIYSQKNMLFLIPSNNKKFLMNKKIELFINIAAFQEMTTDEISEYFEIIKNNEHHDEFELTGISLEDVRSMIKNRIIPYDHMADKKDLESKWGKNIKIPLSKIESDLLPKYLSQNKKKYINWFDEA